VLPLTSRDRVRVFQTTAGSVSGPLVKEDPDVIERKASEALHVGRAEVRPVGTHAHRAADLTTAQASTEAGVDRTTIATPKRLARDGAIAALEASQPGRRHRALPRQPHR
jgi:hypothetical protein